MGNLNLQQMHAHWGHDPAAGFLSPTGDPPGERIKVRGHGLWRGGFVLCHSSFVIVGLLLLFSLLARGEKVPGTKSPSPADLEKSIQRGLDFLLKDQNKDGSWGTAQRTKDLNIFAQVPGAHHAIR